MNAWIVWTFIIWILIFIGINITKKLSPDTWVLCTVENIIVGIVFTIFAIIHII